MVAMDASMMELMALDHIERLRRARAPRRPGLRARTHQSSQWTSWLWLGVIFRKGVRRIASTGPGRSESND